MPEIRRLVGGSSRLARLPWNRSGRGCFTAPVFRPGRLPATAWMLGSALVCACEPAVRVDAGDHAQAKRRAPATAPVEARTVARTLSYMGTIIAPRDATLSSMRGGQIREYSHELGDSVRAGELLVKLEARELAFASRAARASAQQAATRIAGVGDPALLPGTVARKAAWDVAADAVRRAEALRARGSTSEQELIRLRTNEVAARAEYDAALATGRTEFGRLKEMQAIAGQARAVLLDREIRAPFAGVVLERFAELGQMAAPNAPLIRILDPSELYVRFEVPQFDAAEVVLGREVSLSFAGQRISGQIVRFTPGLVGEAHTSVVDARLELPDGVKLLPGVRLPVWLATGDSEVLCEIPTSATRSSAGVSRAWVIEDGRLQERLLSVVRYDGDRMLVRSGLAAGEALVLAPQADFRLGEEVAQ